MSIAGDILWQSFQNVMNTLEQSEANFTAGRDHLLNILRQLKNGELTLDRLIVTDNGIDILPEVDLSELEE